MRPTIDGCVPRPRLVQAIDEAVGRHAVVVVAAPSGSGKSVLVAQWAAERDDVVWVSIEGCHDAHAAAERILESMADMLDSPPVVPAPDDDDPMAVVVEHLYRLPGSTLVVDALDRAPEVSAELARLVRDRPAGMAVVLTTTDEVGLGLASLRASGIVVDLGFVELAFTPDDLAGVLPADDAAALVERTTGWATGVAAFLADPSVPGSGAELHEVAAAVADSLDPEVRSLVLDAAAIGTFTPDLLGEVLDRGDIGAGLARLHQLHLVPLPDRDSGVYELNALVAEAGCALLDRERPGRSLALRREALAYWISRSDPEQALALSEAHPEVGDPVEVLLTHGMAWSVLGHSHAVLHWCERLGTDATEPRHVDLLLLRGFAALQGGWIDLADDSIMAAFAGIDPDSGDTLDLHREALGMLLWGRTLTRRGHLVKGFEATTHARELASVPPRAWPLWTPNLPLLELETAAAAVLADRFDVALELLDHLDAAALGPIAQRVVLACRCIVASLTFDPAAPTFAAILASMVEPDEASTFSATAIGVVGVFDAVAQARSRADSLAALVQSSTNPVLSVLDSLTGARIAAADQDIAAAARHLDEAAAEVASCADPGVLPRLLEHVRDELEIVDLVGAEHAFTDSELDVLVALASDRTEREIAAELYLSHNTVRTYRRRIYRKLDVRTRAEAVVAAADRGLLDGPSRNEP